MAILKIRNVIDEFFDEALIAKTESIKTGGTCKNEQANHILAGYVDKSTHIGGAHYVLGQASRASMQFNAPHQHQLQLQNKIDISPTNIQLEVETNRIKKLEFNKKKALTKESVLKRAEKKKKFAFSKPDKSNYDKGAFIKDNKRSRSVSIEDTDYPPAKKQRKPRTTQYMKQLRICYCDEYCLSQAFKQNDIALIPLVKKNI